MKTRNILYSVLTLIMSVVTLTSCEDVPEPYLIPGTEGGDNNITVIEPAGNGTLETPYNVVGIIQYIQDSETLTDKVYIKGKISQIKEVDASNFGNATFYISDDGSTNNEFYVYRCMSLNNGKFQSADEIKVGDEVVIYGNVTIYNGTYETEANKAYIYSLNGETSTTVPETPVTGTNLLTNGDFETWENGTPVNWQSASTASNATLTQSTDAHSGSYSVSVGFQDDQNKRLAYKELTLKAGTYKYSFYAKSTTADPSQCQAGYVPVTNGSVGSYSYLGYTTINNTSWTQVSGTFTLDATTTVCLVVMNPKTSNYATAQNILVDDASLVTNDGGIDGEEQPGTGDPSTPAERKATVTKAENLITMVDANSTESENTITCDFNTFGFEHQSAVSEVTLDDGTKITFAQEGGNNYPTFYTATKGVRMYALNSMTITASKPIAKIVATCDSYSGTNYVGNEQMYVDITGNTWKVVNDWTGNSGGTQIRVQTITITYAN